MCSVPLAAWEMRQEETRLFQCQRSNPRVRAAFAMSCLICKVDGVHV